MDKHVRLVHFHFHGLSIGYEIGADITAVELHTLHDFDGGVHTLCFADSDDTVFADFAHSVGNEFTDFGIVISRDSSHLFDLVEVIAYHFGLLLDIGYYSSNGFVDTAFEVHRISASRDVLEAYTNDSLCQYGSGGCTVTSLVTGLGSHFFNELRTEVLTRIREFDFFCNGHTVLGYLRRTVFLFDNHITTFRAECNFHGISQLVNATFEGITCLNIVH